jgi:ComF family protein
MDVGWRLGAMLARGCPFEAGEHDLVAPVPLYPARLRARGFNQAWMLAAPVARRLGTPIVGSLLRRTRPTDPQVALPERDRRRNVHGAFAVVHRRPVDGLRILLVDDVFTTGATVGECARVLRAAHAAAVDVLTVARAMAPRPGAL